MPDRIIRSTSDLTRFSAEIDALPLALRAQGLLSMLCEARTLTRLHYNF